MIPIKRFDRTLPLPKHQTASAAGFDLCAREEVVIPPGSIGYIPLNVALRPPPGHMVLLVPRSSLHKRGLLPANGVGIIDGDYAGDSDEYIAVLYNITATSVTVSRGDRIMQGVIVPYQQAVWQEVEVMQDPNRGRFGTTGV